MSEDQHRPYTVPEISLHNPIELSSPFNGSLTTLRPQYHWTLNAIALNVLTQHEMTVLYQIFIFYDSSTIGDLLPSISLARFHQFLRDCHLTNTTETLLPSQIAQPKQLLSSKTISLIFAQAVLGKLRTYLDKDGQPALTFDLFCGALLNCSMMRYPEDERTHISLENAMKEIIQIIFQALFIDGVPADNEYEKKILVHNHQYLNTAGLALSSHSSILNDKTTIRPVSRLHSGEGGRRKQIDGNARRSSVSLQAKYKIRTPQEIKQKVDLPSIRNASQQMRVGLYDKNVADNFINSNWDQEKLWSIELWSAQEAQGWKTQEDYQNSPSFQQVTSMFFTDSIEDERIRQAKAQELYDIDKNLAMQFDSKVIQIVRARFELFDVYDRGWIPRDEIFPLISGLPKRKLGIIDINYLLGILTRGVHRVIDRGLSSMSKNNETLVNNSKLQLNEESAGLTLTELLQGLFTCRRTQSAPADVTVCGGNESNNDHQIALNTSAQISIDEITGFEREEVSNENQPHQSVDDAVSDASGEPYLASSPRLEAVDTQCVFENPQDISILPNEKEKSDQGIHNDGLNTTNNASEFVQIVNADTFAETAEQDHMHIELKKPTGSLKSISSVKMDEPLTGTYKVLMLLGEVADGTICIIAEINFETGDLKESQGVYFRHEPPHILMESVSPIHPVIKNTQQSLVEMLLLLLKKRIIAKQQLGFILLNPNQLEEMEGMLTNERIRLARLAKKRSKQRRSSRISFRSKRSSLKLPNRLQGRTERIAQPKNKKRAADTTSTLMVVMSDALLIQARKNRERKKALRDAATAAKANVPDTKNAPLLDTQNKENNRHFNSTPLLNIPLKSNELMLNAVKKPQRQKSVIQLATEAKIMNNRRQKVVRKHDKPMKPLCPIKIQHKLPDNLNHLLSSWDINQDTNSSWIADLNHTLLMQSHCNHSYH